MNKLSKRKRQIALALYELGGSASTKQIADRLGLNTNGVSQTLGVMPGIVEVTKPARGSAMVWSLVNKNMNEWDF